MMQLDTRLILGLVIGLVLCCLFVGCCFKNKQKMTIEESSFDSEKTHYEYFEENENEESGDPEGSSMGPIQPTPRDLVDDVNSDAMLALGRHTRDIENIGGRSKQSVQYVRNKDQAGTPQPELPSEACIWKRDHGNPEPMQVQISDGIGTAFMTEQVPQLWDAQGDSINRMDGCDQRIN